MKFVATCICTPKQQWKSAKHQALLITEKVIDGHIFSTKKDNTATWENSEMRAWLNSEFLNTVFTPAEQMLICKTTLDNGENNETTDKIFFLSEEEINKYLKDKRERIAEITSRARDAGVRYGIEV